MIRYTISVNRFATTTTNDEKNKIPKIVGVSLATIDCTAKVPNPGQLNTVSTRTAPDTIEEKTNPMVVTTG
ncbi:uncharacterized protein METZ01_LOCUS186365, partial [marine metagenome]